MVALLIPVAAFAPVIHVAMAIVAAVIDFKRRMRSSSFEKRRRMCAGQHCPERRLIEEPLQILGSFTLPRG